MRLAAIALLTICLAPAAIGAPVPLNSTVEDTAPALADIMPILPSPFTGDLQYITLRGLESFVVSVGAKPGGTAGQLQFNDFGVFGGLTLSGDCTLAQPAITCTRTGGAAFAPSATVDATNAANIVSGNLSVARLNGGSGASGATFWRGDGTWAAAGGGSVTSVATDNGLTGGPITGAGTIGLAIAGSTAGQVLTSAGGSSPPTWQGAPATAPGGASGQLQYDNAGAFGGFTLAGDCTLSLPTIVCTRTNGSTFAASATVDATNAGNITAGALALARLNTAGSSAGQVLTSTGSGAAPAFASVTTPAEVVIARVTPAGTGTVSFTSIPQTFTHLKIIASGRSSVSAASDYLNMTFNGDTAAHYDMQWLYTTNGSAASDPLPNQSWIRAGLMPAATATAGYAGNATTVIYNYTDTNLDKTSYSTFGGASQATFGDLWNYNVFGDWQSTAAITRIDIVLASGGANTFATGTVFELIGIN